MREVHRFIADSIYLSDRYEEMVQRILARKLEHTGRKIAIAGAGPAGLTAAFYLALLGHDVTVYDSKPEAGGMLRFALPEYRLPKSALVKEIEFIERLGVKFIFNTRVGFDIPLNDLDDHFDSVFLSIGTWKESWIYQPGTELKGVYPALTFLEAIAKGEDVDIGRKVAIIGGGNAAIDSARSALRKGAEVTVFYRRERKDMPAIEEETRAAREEGAKFIFLAAPHRIIGDASGNVKAIEIVKTRLGEYDTSGRRKPVLTDEIQRFDCDAVIFAVGESVDLDFARASGLSLKENGTIEVNRFTLESSRPRFYRWRRCHYRSLQRLQRHGLWQAGGPHHRPAIDGNQSLGQDLSLFRLRTNRPGKSQSQSPPRWPHPCSRSSASAQTPKWSPASRTKRHWTKPAVACAAT